MTELDEDLANNTSTMTELVRQSQAAALLDKTGIGPVTAAIALTAWSTPAASAPRPRSPVSPASTPSRPRQENTVRHRLDRGGDRRLNRALHIATITRMTHDPDTRAYVERRRAEGRTTSEIRRMLKRYLARHIYRTLNAART